jgi:heat-inducible transcriptional repressor
MTTRQERILKTIVEYYVQSAAPVGSQVLAEQFRVSPATVRAEMAHLEQAGYVTHPYTSAGRVPTEKGYRFYIESLMEPAYKLDATTRQRNAIERRVRTAGSPQAAIKMAVDSLVHVTRNIGFATMGVATYTKGFSQLFHQPEFANNLGEIAGLLDNLDLWLAETRPTEDVEAFIGEENTVGKDSGCAVIVSGYTSPYSNTNYVGIIGSTRQSYGNVMRIVNHTARTLEEVLHE